MIVQSLYLLFTKKIEIWVCLQAVPLVYFTPLFLRLQSSSVTFAASTVAADVLRTPPQLVRPRLE